MEKTLEQAIKEKEAREENGAWYPAAGGTETPFKTRRGFTLLYCYQPSTGKHAYLNVENDLFLTDEEAEAALA